jgi:sugar lactone lactonase YvrE
MNDVISQRPGRRVRRIALTSIALLAAPLLCFGEATISVFAGTGNPPINPGAIGDGGQAKNAFLDGPESVTLDPQGNLYIRERARVRKVTPQGIISTVAGNGTNGYSGDNGPATSAQLGLGPQRAGLATDSAGNLYISDSNNFRVRKVDTSGKITTVAGNGQMGIGSAGNGGPATNTALCFPAGIAVDHLNNLYIGSSICGGVRKVDASGTITTVATKSAGPSYGVAVDANGNLYINAEAAFQIRKVSADGTVTVVAGNGTSGYSGDGGPATSAQLFEVDGVAVDKSGNVFITDSGNGRVREVDTAGTITTVAGHGTVGPGLGCANLFTTGCPATNLKFGPSDVVLDGSGGLYTAGFIKGLVYKVSGLGGSGPPSSSPARTISHIADGGGFRTTIILLNTGAVAANFTLNFWSDTGGPLALNLGADGVKAVLSGAIPAHGARFIRTAGTTPGLNRGWAQLTAPAAVDGNSIFGLQTPGQADSEAAVPLSPAGGTDLFLPFDNTPGFATGVAFADPGQQAATVSGTFRDESGTQIVDAHTVAVPALGHNADVLSNFFTATQGKRGAAHFHAATSIFGLGIRANGKAFTTIEALSGVTTAQKIIPHIASGGGWKTTFLLVNTGTAAAQFTLDFFADGGTALALPLDTGAMATTITGMIPAGGLRVVKALSTGHLVTGWARLTVTGLISGTAIFGLGSAGQPDSEAAVPFALDSGGATQLYMPFDFTTGYSTGIALMHNGPTTPTIVTLTVFDEAGHSLGSPAVVTITTGFGHVSKVLSDLFPGIAGKRGTVSISADHNIFALGIRANGAAFTSLKVVTPH